VAETDAALAQESAHGTVPKEDSIFEKFSEIQLLVLDTIASFSASVT
jgi:hypothetical protein